MTINQDKKALHIEVFSMKYCLYFMIKIGAYFSRKMNAVTLNILS